MLSAQLSASMQVFMELLRLTYNFNANKYISYRLGYELVGTSIGYLAKINLSQMARWF